MRDQLRPARVDHWNILREIEVYSHIKREKIDIEIYIVEDSDNDAILIRVHDRRYTEMPETYGAHFFCDTRRQSERDQDWLANIVAGIMVDTLVNSTENLQREMKHRWQRFTELL